MVAPLGARVAQADEQFVGLQDKIVALMERATVCHNLTITVRFAAENR
jgi:hypothetical protein